MAAVKEKKPIDTAKVAGRRQIRFASISDLAVEIDRILAADKAGRLGRVGNWSAAQIFSHLARWIEMSYEGFPFRVPGLVRFFAKLSKRRILRDGMKPGFRLPKSATEKVAAYPPPDAPIDESALRLKKALARLKAGEAPPHESPAFGKLTLQEWTDLHLRHAELHLSFLHP